MLDWRLVAWVCGGAVFLGALPLIAVALWSWWSGLGQRRRWQPPPYGFETFEGKPGAGKSFIATWRLVESVLHDKRPVYTNLPLKFRVVRAYLRHRGREQFPGDAAAGHAYGEMLAGLVVQLHQEHFRNFMDRQHALMEFRQRARAQAALKGEHINEDRLRAMFAAEHGPFVCETTVDPETGGMRFGNWIPLNAIICIDEVHHWFPMSEQATETRRLLDYASMVRHHVHWVWLCTQDRMQMNKRLRDMTQFYWHVRNRGDDRLVGGLRFKHLGIRAFGYAKFTPEAERSTRLEDRRPLEEFNVFYWLPRFRWVFRCYESFTHQGGSRRMRSELRAARAAVGLDEHGRPRVAAVAVVKAAESERVTMGGLISGMVRTSLVAACGWFTGVLMAPAVASYLASSVPGAAAAGVSSAGVSEGASGAVVEGASSAAPVDYGLVAGRDDAGDVRTVAPFPLTKVEGMTSDSVRADGETFTIGRTSGETQLVLVNSETGLSLWVHGRAAWVWRRGSRPRYLGEATDVFRDLRAMAYGASRGRGGVADVEAGPHARGVADGAGPPPQ